MDDSIPSALRELARQNFEQLISTEAYRRERGRLLNLLVAEQDAEPVLATMPRRLDQLRPMQHPDAVARPAGAGVRWLWPALAAATALLAVAVSVLWFVARTREADVQTAAGAAQVPAPLVPAESAPAESTTVGDIAAHFVAAGDWSAPAVGALRREWHELTPEERADAQRRAWFAPLLDEVRRRLLFRENSPQPWTDADNALTSLAEELGVALPEAPPQRPTQHQVAPALSPAPSAEALTRQSDADGDAQQVDAAAAAAAAVAAGEHTPAEAPPPPAPEPAKVVVSTTPATRAASADAIPAPPAVVRGRNGCSRSMLAADHRGCADALVVGGMGPAMMVLPAGVSPLGAAPRVASPPHRSSS